MNHGTFALCMNFVILTVSCGSFPRSADSAKGSDSSAQATTATFQGFVNSAFELTVDGAKYNDMEDFYTQELKRLPAKVTAAGYDSSWRATFDAQVGMNDLWQNMTVYISPVANRGYQGEGSVGQAGGFSITLPPTALDSEYRVRAIKRIGVLLTKDEEKVRICYNFSASEKSVQFTDREKPIVLDTFTAAITAYDCQVAESGIKIPTASSSSGQPATPKKLPKGASRDEVIASLGLADMFVTSPTRWCWGKSDAKASVCANVAYERCQCWVDFDDAGKVAAQSNVRGDLLDLATW